MRLERMHPVRREYFPESTRPKLDLAAPAQPHSVQGVRKRELAERPQDEVLVVRGPRADLRRVLERACEESCVARWGRHLCEDGLGAGVHPKAAVPHRRGSERRVGDRRVDVGVVRSHAGECRRALRLIERGEGSREGERRARG